MDREPSTSHDVLERMLRDESAEPTKLRLSLLEDITNHFSLDHQIGRGGFAVVYKGVVGQGAVAVKKLSNTFGIHENKFLEEIDCLMKAKHKNIVRFLGYCSDTQGEVEEYKGKRVMAEQRNWLLCFEYARNGSLDKHITGASCGLNWRERYRIIKGICEGLRFLHEKRILHLDLKPANVLLDDHMVPKIADFGLSRCLGEEQTHAITQNINGTLGYTDPEYLKTGQITFVSDIYSLGVIIMEILAGVRRYLEDESVVESWINRLGSSEGGDMQLEQVKVCSKIGIECMDLDPKKRPVVRHIIDRLDKASDEAGIGSSLVEPQISLTREQFEERTGKLGASSLQKVDAEECSEILEDAAERFAWLNIKEGQLKVVQLPIWGVQDMKGKANRHGASNSSSVCTGFSEKNIVNIFYWKANNNFNWNDGRKLEKSHFINIFGKEELRPILKSSNIIGKRASEVYKGVVDNALVAVKKTFIGNGSENKKLENEVFIHSQIIHKNIVWLIGFCLEMDTPILVYEFLPRGSLHDILHSGKKVPLNMDVRLNIVAESAHGLAYLHSQAHSKIRHGDVKPAHILLDDNFIPKISNFGLSRVIARDNQCTSSVFGDITYSDPVYLQTGLVTEKSDVYSFGLVILELISRKKATRSGNHSLVKSFLAVHEKGKKATELFDKEIAVTGNLELLGCLAEIAVECLNLDVDQRPSMTDVAERLVILTRSRSSLVEQNKEGQLWGVQDTKRPGTSISSSISTGLYKLNNLDIFNNKVVRNIESNGRRVLENSSFIKIFRKKELEPIITRSNLVGTRALIKVYKGVVGNAWVMLKVSGTRLWNEHFENEIIIQSQVVHKNIHRLIGCCLEMDSLVLVYESLSRGSLDGFLHGGSKVPLSLDMLLAIVAESAQGLAYLHSQAHGKIVHGNVKPGNILLDDNFMPKISYFGTSRLIARGNRHIVYHSGFRRTSLTSVTFDMDYMDPVYMQTGLPTEKSDVYSFGVVILEVISRKKPTHSDYQNLVKSFLEVHKKGKKATELFDKDIAVAGNLEILDALAEIAVQCLNLDADQRPTMTYVSEHLLILQRYHSSHVARQ